LIDGGPRNHVRHRLDEGKQARATGPASLKLQDLTDRGELLRIAIFTLAELFVGVAKGTRPHQERMAIEQCVALFELLPFERNTAEIFGSIVGELEKQGQKISDIDALIASVALEHSELLVTRNRKHFDRIPGLQVESY
jgi:tRNA(fMet)-specific endonuclease VapC